MSLERLIKEFAENTRLYLLAEVAAKSKDLKTAKIKKFDENGQIIVELDGKDIVVDGVGSAYQTEGTKVFVDKTDSIEYKRAEKKEPAVLPERKKVEVTPVKKLPRSLVIPALFLEEEEEEQLEEYEIPTTGFHLITYGPGREDNREVELDVDLNYSTTNFETDSSSFSSFENSLYAGGKTYEFAGSAIWARANDISGAPTASAEAQNPVCGNLSVSVNVRGAAQTKQTTGSRSPAQYGVYSVTAQANYVQLAIILSGGEAQAETITLQIRLPETKYYYDFGYTVDDGKNRRVVDLSNYISSGEILQQKLVHNYANREGDDVFVYSTFFVRTVNFAQESVSNTTHTSSGTGITYETTSWDFGRLDHRIIHIRLSLKTGRIEFKNSQSINPGVVDVFSEFDTWEDQGYDWYGSISTVTGDGEYNASATGGWRHTVLSNPNREGFFGVLNYTGRRIKGFNPEPVWKNAFSGDWLYNFRDIPWDANAAANVATDELWAFLSASFKSGVISTDLTLYGGLDSDMPNDWVYDPLSSTNSGGFYYQLLSPGDQYYNAQPVHNDYHDIEAIGSIAFNSTEVKFDDYFDGSTAGAPDDAADWQEFNNSNRKGPDRSAAVAELHMAGNPYYNYIPPV